MTGGTDVRCHEQGKASVSYQVQDIHDTASGGVTEPKHYDEGESGLMEQSYNLHNATYPFRIQSHLLISPTPPLLEQSRTMSIHRPHNMFMMMMHIQQNQITAAEMLLQIIRLHAWTSAELRMVQGGSSGPGLKLQTDIYEV